MKDNFYFMPFNIPYYRIDDNTVALESALSEHLKLWGKYISSTFDKLVIGMTQMNQNDYEKNKENLAVIQEESENIYFVTLYKETESLIIFWLKQYPHILLRLYKVIKKSNYIHSGLSYNMNRPIGITSIFIAFLLKKPTCFVCDIDFRNSASMNYQTKKWSLKSYLLCKYIYDPLRKMQIIIATKFCNLVLLKGQNLAKDYGKGKENVKNFLDSAYSSKYIIKKTLLTEKIKTVENSSQTLELVYFGRLVRYKGIDICLKAIALAIQKTDQKIRFTIIGNGDELNNLKNLGKQLKIESYIRFCDPFPYGIKLFQQLYKYHLLLATPLEEDTPRSALDAMAAGIPVLAFDTYYYQNLAQLTHAVETVPWLSTDNLARKIVELNYNRKNLASLMENTLNFANENTQEIWLNKRWKWTLNNF